MNLYIRYCYRFLSVFALLLLSIQVVKILSLYSKTEPFIDFHVFYQTCLAIIQGLNPYTMELTEGIPGNSVFPAQGLIFFPFTLFSEEVAARLFLSVNILATIILFRSVARNSQLWTYPFSEWTSFHFFSLLLSVFLFIHSFAFYYTLRQGQTSLLAFFCIYLATFSYSKWRGSFYTFLSLCFKYSMVPLYLLALVWKKKTIPIYLGIFAFLIFSILGFYLIGPPLKILHIYAEKLKIKVLEGWDRIPNGVGYNILTFEYLKPEIINQIVRIGLLLTAISVCIKERKSSEISHSLLLLLGCIDMLVVYHRSSDIIGILLLLIMRANHLWIAKRYWECSFCFSFLLYFNLPHFSLARPISVYLGKFFENSNWIHLTYFPTKEIKVFPLDAFMMTLLGVYAFYVYFSKKKGCFLTT